jgi:hypothetical protein
MDPMCLVIKPRMRLGASILAIGLLVIFMALTAPAAGAAVPPEEDPSTPTKAPRLWRTLRRALC